MAYGEGEPGFNKKYVSSLFKDDNFLQLLSGLSQAVGTRNGKMGSGAQMGAMFSNQLQSENAQAAFEKQMKQKSSWAQIMSKLLGRQQGGQMPGGPYNTNAEAESTMPSSRLGGDFISGLTDPNNRGYGLRGGMCDGLWRR